MALVDPEDRTTQETLCVGCAAKDARVAVLATHGGQQLRVTFVMHVKRVGDAFIQEWSGVTYLPCGRLLRAEDCVNEDEVILELLAQAEGRR